MQSFFSNYAHLIVFIHILGAFVWVGGMIAIRVAVHPVLQTIEDPKVRLGKTLDITGRLFALVAPFIILILITGLIMTIAMNGHHSPQKMLFVSKEAIWTIMSLNYIFMALKRFKAKKLFDSGDLASAKAVVANIPNLLLPVNIILGLAALWLGVSLRGY